jgi:streptogramin lyase
LDGHDEVHDDQPEVTTMPQTLRTRIQMLAAAMLVTVAALLLGAGATRAAGVQTFTVPQPSAGLNDMALGPGGNLYFTEGNAVGGAYHIGSITPSGTFGPPVAVPVGQYDNPGEGPTNILSSGGSLWFRSDIGNVIDRYAPGGSLTTVFGDPDTPDLDYATSLGPSDTGGVWATDYDGDEQPGGQTDLRLFGANAGAATTPQYLAATYSATWFPTPLVLGLNGNVWYTDDSDYLRSTSDAGATQSHPISGIPLGAPNAIAFDGKGDLWFVSQYPGTAFTAAGDGAVGELPAGAGAATATALDSNIAPTSIAKGPDGNMYFGYIVGGNSPDGGIGQINTATGKVTLADLSGFQPASVTFTPDGALWFVDSGLNQIDRVMPSSLFGGGSGPGPGPGPGPNPGPGPVKLPQAPKLSLKAPAEKLADVRKHKRLTATCTLAGSGTCTVKATIAAVTAKRLKLKLASKRAKTYTLATASKTLKRKGSATLALKLSTHEARALTRVKSLKLALTATSTAAAHRPRRVEKTVTLR